MLKYVPIIVTRISANNLIHSWKDEDILSRINILSGYSENFIWTGWWVMTLHKRNQSLSVALTGIMGWRFTRNGGVFIHGFGERFRWRLAEIADI